ncbi:MAG: M1 family metallopeptidase [Myxococcales bacterium]
MTGRAQATALRTLRAALVMLAAATPAAGTAAAGAAPGPAYDVLHYDADLEPDLATRSLRGRVSVRFANRGTAPLAGLELDARALEVEAVAQAGAGPARFEAAADRLRVTLPAPVPAGGEGTVEIRYRARAGKGLHFYPGGFYTAFDTEEWLPCDAAPDDRATASFRWAVPPDLTLVGSGSEGERIPTGDGREWRRWDQRTPFPAYVLGAAAGPWRSTCRPTAGIEICAWGGPTAAERLAPTLVAAEAAFPLLAGWAGVPYPGKRYDQVFVADRMAQELAGMAIIGESYLSDLASDPQEDWLVIHELAHSWWGNLVTARSWSDFWLNEGMVTFIVAAVKERRWGAAAYEQELALARRRFAKALRTGSDRALVFHGWSRSSDMSGPVTYSKGALVMNLLRREVGETAFWAGLRAYTRAGAGRGVTSRDLQLAMERASKRDLRGLFETWVYRSPPTPELVAVHRRVGGDLVVEVRQSAAAPAAAAPIAMDVAVETAQGRQRRRLVLRGGRGEIRFRVGARPLRSVRVDDGARLPVRVKHERPTEMLLAQTGHEPDVVGRLEALEQLSEACSGATPDPACASRAETFAKLEEIERSPLMRRELKAARKALAAIRGRRY